MTELYNFNQLGTRNPHPERLDYNHFKKNKQIYPSRYTRDC